MSWLLIDSLIDRQQEFTEKLEIGYSPKVVKAVLFDVAGVLTESYGHIILETAVAIDANIDLLAEALIPVFLGEEDTDEMGHKLERGEAVSYTHLTLPTKRIV